MPTNIAYRMQWTKKKIEIKKPENLFCVAVKHAKRLTKRLNKNKKSTEDSDSDEDDLVRMIDKSVILEAAR